VTKEYIYSTELWLVQNTTNLELRYHLDIRKIITTCLLFFRKKYRFVPVVASSYLSLKTETKTTADTSPYEVVDGVVPKEMCNKEESCVYETTNNSRKGENKDPSEVKFDNEGMSTQPNICYVSTRF